MPAVRTSNGNRADPLVCVKLAAQRDFVLAGLRVNTVRCWHHLVQQRFDLLIRAVKMSAVLIKII